MFIKKKVLNVYKKLATLFKITANVDIDMLTSQ